MADQRAEVKNAADREQVKRAGRKDQERTKQLEAAVRESMRSPAVRLMMWELLAKAGVFHSIFHTSSLIYYNAGRQDFGHELMALLLDADEALYDTMMREGRTRQTRDRAETDAVHTQTATTMEGSDG